MVDTNQTAAAVQALAALGGHDAVTDKAVGWLKSVQNEDGGWGYTAGSPATPTPPPSSSARSPPRARSRAR